MTPAKKMYWICTSSESTTTPVCKIVALFIKDCHFIIVFHYCNIADIFSFEGGF